MKRARLHVPFGTYKTTGRATELINEALTLSQISRGSLTRQLENQFKAKFAPALSHGIRAHATACSSGTAGLTTALLALYSTTDAQRGDEIICPALTFSAVPNSILAAGFIPRFVDVDIATLNLDPGLIEPAISEKTRGMVVVATLGKPPDYRSILEISHSHDDLPIIEDVSEALGAKYSGKLVGSFGYCSITSFYVAHIVTSGEGGMVWTYDPGLGPIIASISSHGRPPGDNTFDFQRVGLNAKMPELSAAIGISELELFNSNFARRTSILQSLRQAAGRFIQTIHLYPEEPGSTTSPHAFPIVIREGGLSRDEVLSAFKAARIETKLLFGSLPTQHPAYAFLGCKPGDFPVAEYIGRNGFHIGIHQHLTDTQVQHVINTMHTVLGEH